MQQPQDSLDWAPRVTEERQQRWRNRPVAVIAAVLIAIVFTQTPPGRGVLRLVGLQSPPAYTALYFTNPDRLPAELHTGHVQFPVTFSVQNSSQSDKTYQWRIAVQDGRTTTNVFGKLSLAGGATAVETKAVKAVCRSGGALQVIVSLATPADAINFRVVCRA